MPSSHSYTIFSARQSKELDCVALRIAHCASRSHLSHLSICPRARLCARKIRRESNCIFRPFVSLWGATDRGRWGLAVPPPDPLPRWIVKNEKDPKRPPHPPRLSVSHPYPVLSTSKAAAELLV